MNICKTKKLIRTGMLCALAYAAVAVGRVPLVLFLKYDPKDVIIGIGGLIYGPVTALTVSVITSAVQMLTISGTGVLGCIMNILSSSLFACTAAMFYKRKRSVSGAVLGLLIGWGCQTAGMMFWNYWIAPLYMGYSREVIKTLLITAFLPFNLMKGGLNAAITMVLYKPVMSALRQSGLPEKE